MKKFYIPQIEDETTEKKPETGEQEAPKVEPKKPARERDRFVSTYYGTKVKDEITIMGAQFGNRGAQYDSFRDPKDRIRKDDYMDYVTHREDAPVSARSDMTEEQRKTPSYLIKDPAYKDIMEPSKPVFQEEDNSFVRAEEADEPQIVSRTKIEEEPEVEVEEEQPRFTASIAPRIEEEKPVYANDDLEDTILDTEMDDLEIDFGEEKKFTSLDDEDEAEEVSEAPLPEPTRDSFKQARVKEAAPKKKRIRYVAPPLSMLKHGNGETIGDNAGVEYQKNGINETLAEFNVGGRVVNFVKGPVVTQFEIALDPGVRMQSVANIASNIQAKIAAMSIRIQSPIPGKSTVGIEVPNQDKTMVYFGDLLQKDRAFLNDGKPLNVALGLDLFDNPLYLDIAKAPHVLIGGTTGSGKSVCMNCIITSILYKAHPDDVKLIIVDPKIIEFSSYEDLPHLAMPIVTEAKVAQMALKWCVDEMERRYQMLKPVHAKNISEYNRIASSDMALPHIPYILIVIDELADLLGVSAADTMSYIQRITQNGRAAGIHMILATQRPSADVISGTIKNCVPFRIAFKVKDQVNSSIILDHAGAEKLLGNGDMLYNNGVEEIRAQGAYISSEEINEITDFIRDECDTNYILNIDDVMQKEEAQESTGVDDELFGAVARFVVEENNASINRIQKTFNMGFNKAQAIMESLENLGIVSENLGSRARVVQVTMEQLEDILDNL
ncbi:MAG: DNA translocase FtsK [Bacilli bacterium]|nr:DNA translocase FtsK [Bacilli bacterium]